MCEKHAVFAIQERTPLVDAPKDVRRLEALKPNNVPSMRERYDAAVSKEKRLEAAANPLFSSKNKNDDVKDTKNKRQRVVEEESVESSDDEMFQDGGSEEDEGGEKKQKRPVSNKKRKVTVVNEADLKNVKALEEKDVVQEGIVWSDSE